MTSFCPLEEKVQREQASPSRNFGLIDKVSLLSVQSPGVAQESPARPGPHERDAPFGSRLAGGTPATPPGKSKRRGSARPARPAAPRRRALQTKQLLMFTLRKQLFCDITVPRRPEWHLVARRDGNVARSDRRKEPVRGWRGPAGGGGCRGPGSRESQWGILIVTVNLQLASSSARKYKTKWRPGVIWCYSSSRRRQTIAMYLREYTTCFKLSA